jgi:hypothetical protein
MLTLIANLLLCRSPPTPMIPFTIANLEALAMSAGSLKFLMQIHFGSVPIGRDML